VADLAGRHLDTFPIKCRPQDCYAAERVGVKRLVLAGIVVAESGGGFNPVQQVSIATEEYLKRSSLEWGIGQNGIYIEPDLEYIDNYRKAEKIANCAADGHCAYTCRPELALAYAQMLTKRTHLGETYVLAGQPITQEELAAAINEVFGTDLRYESLSVDECRSERQAALGDFLGAVDQRDGRGVRFRPRGWPRAPVTNGDDGAWSAAHDAG
jgi:NAD(P)H dehydrogenase (quinone)